MTAKNRRDEFAEIFAGVNEQERRLVDRLIDEVVFLEARMDEVRGLPFVSVNPKNKSQQRTTAAAKVYKECTQSYMNAIRILAGILRKEDTSAEDTLMKLLNDC